MLIKGLDVVLREINELCSQPDGPREITVCEPEYDKEQIDVLILSGHLIKTDISTPDEWKYIVEPAEAGIGCYSKRKSDILIKRQQYIMELLKFTIPTVISIIALIVAIVK